MAKARIYTEFRCKDCANCHSPYNLNYLQQYVLGKCTVLNHTVLLSMNQCNKFKKAKKPLI